METNLSRFIQLCYELSEYGKKKRRRFLSLSSRIKILEIMSPAILKVLLGAMHVTNFLYSGIIFPKGICF